MDNGGDAVHARRTVDGLGRVDRWLSTTWSDTIRHRWQLFDAIRFYSTSKLGWKAKRIGWERAPIFAPQEEWEAYLKWCKEGVGYVEPSCNT